MTTDTLEQVPDLSKADYRIEPAGDALVLRAASGPAPAMDRMARALPAEAGRVALVLATGVEPALTRIDAELTRELLRWLGPGASTRPDRGVRLVIPPRADPNYLRAVACALAALLDLEIVAPTGPLRALRPGELFVTGSGQGWLTVTANSSRLAGPRYPAPTWQDRLPVELKTASPEVRASAVPAGLWLRPSTVPDAPTALPYLAEPESERPTLFLTGWTDRDTLGAELLAHCRKLLVALPEDVTPIPIVLTATMVAPPPDDSGSWPQWLANRLRRPVTARPGLTVRGSDGTQQVVLPDAGGRVAWRPFVREIDYLPATDPNLVGPSVPQPVARRWIAPGPDLPDLGNASYALGDAWRVESVAAGLWIHPITDDALPVRFLAPDPAAVPVVVGTSESAAPPEAVVETLGALLRAMPRSIVGRLRLWVPPSASATTKERLAALGFGYPVTFGAALFTGPNWPVSPAFPRTDSGSVPHSGGPEHGPVPQVWRHRNGLIELSLSADESGRLRPVTAGGAASVVAERSLGDLIPKSATGPAQPTEEPDQAEPVEHSAPPWNGVAEAVTSSTVSEVPMTGFVPPVTAASLPAVATAPAADLYRAPAPLPSPPTPSPSAPSPPTPGRRPLTAPPESVRTDWVRTDSVLTAPAEEALPATAEPPAPAIRPTKPPATASAAPGPSAPSPELMAPAATTAPNRTDPWVIPADWRSTMEQRQMLRLTMGWRHDTEAQAIVVLLAERPGLRGVAAADTEAVITDLVAVRTFLTGDSAAAVAAQRSGAIGKHAALLACATSGLRRVPSYRGTAFACVPGAAAEARNADWYPDGRIYWEPAPLVTSARRGRIEEGDLELVLWSVAGRRCDDFVGASETAPVVFAPGTRFGVLASEETESGGRRVYFAEIHDWELDQWHGKAPPAGNRVIDRLRAAVAPPPDDAPAAVAFPPGLDPQRRPFALPPT